MRTLLKGCVVILCCALWTTAAISAPNMQDGMWEITMMTDIPNMPAGMMPPIKHTSCLTKNDMVPQKQESGCSKPDVKTSGNTVSWKVTCEKGKTVSEGKVTYAGTKFDGVINTTTTDGNQKMLIKSKISGKRVGACK